MPFSSPALRTLRFCWVGLMSPQAPNERNFAADTVCRPSPTAVIELRLLPFLYARGVVDDLPKLPEVALWMAMVLARRLLPTDFMGTLILASKTWSEEGTALAVVVELSPT